MRAPYPSNRITSPVPEASGDRPPLPPQFSYGPRLSSLQPRMPGTVPSFRMPVIHEAMPSNSEISPRNNLNVGLHFRGMMHTYTPAFNDPRKSSPSCQGIEFHEGRWAGSSNAGCGTSNGIELCRLFRSGKGCAYGAKCRYLHEIPEKTMDSGFSSQNYKVGSVVSGHVMDRRSEFDKSKEVRTTGETKISVHSEIPKPEYFRTRPCYPWQTTGHCPYGNACRFIHGETGILSFQFIVHLHCCDMISSDLQLFEQE